MDKICVVFNGMNTPPREAHSFSDTREWLCTEANTGHTIICPALTHSLSLPFSISLPYTTTYIESHTSTCTPMPGIVDDVVVVVVVVIVYTYGFGAGTTQHTMAILRVHRSIGERSGYKGAMPTPNRNTRGVIFRHPIHGNSESLGDNGVYSLCNRVRVCEYDKVS